MGKSLDGFLGFLTLGHCTASEGCSKHSDKGGNLWHKMGLVTTDSQGDSISYLIEMAALGVAALIGLYMTYIFVADILIPLIF
jgi:hypothetical protein